jgi:hypothetical protein
MVFTDVILDTVLDARLAIKSTVCLVLLAILISDRANMIIYLNTNIKLFHKCDKKIKATDYSAIRYLPTNDANDLFLGDDGILPVFFCV